jgi:hypothetical protein
MGRKRKAEAMTTEVEEQTHAVRLDLPTRAHKLLRRVAADEDVSMATFARDSLMRLLEDEAKRRGIKL